MSLNGHTLLPGFIDTHGHFIYFGKNLIDADLFGAADVTELVRSPNLVVHVDVAHRGVGTATCGPDVDERFRIPTGRFDFGYRIKLIEGRA